MLTNKIILFTVIVSFFVCDVYGSNSSGEKTRTSSRMFRKMKSNQTRNCQYIKTDFHKLQGHWNFVQRMVSARNTPKIRCGHLTVNETSDVGFKSILTYISNENRVIRIPMNGIYINETVVRIPQLKDLVTGEPEWKYPSFIEMGICDNNSILITEPIHYTGGGMVFTRDMPESNVLLNLRFGTYKQENGEEFVEDIGTNCNISKYQLRNSGILLN